MQPQRQARPIAEGSQQDSDDGRGRRSTHRLPAEWEPQEATWLIWPDHTPMVAHWHGHESELRRFFQMLLPCMQRFEQVHLLVAEQTQAPPAAVSGADRPQRQVGIASDDIWLRDTAPTFLVPRPTSRQLATRPPALRALCGRWQAYGGNYHPFDRDAQVALRLARHLQADAQALPFVLEGGAFDGDGDGTVLASQRSIVCERRNPGRSRRQLENLILEHLHARRVLWIDACLQGDDTDGHVDQLARFVAPGRVLVANQPDPRDAEHAMLQRLQQQLRCARDANGRPLEVIPVDLPEPQTLHGRRLAASHLNFYIGNRAIYMPSFDGSSDAAAATILGRCFPERQIIAIDCRVLIRGGGALHCISHQQPSVAGMQQPCNNSRAQ